jgi:hypothetical protein
LDFEESKSPKLAVAFWILHKDKALAKALLLPGYVENGNLRKTIGSQKAIMLISISSKMFCPSPAP